MKDDFKAGDVLIWSIYERCNYPHEGVIVLTRKESGQWHYMYLKNLVFGMFSANALKDHTHMISKEGK